MSKAKNAKIKKLIEQIRDLKKSAAEKEEKITFLQIANAEQKKLTKALRYAIAIKVESAMAETQKILEALGNGDWE